MGLSFWNTLNNGLKILKITPSFDHDNKKLVLKNLDN